MTRSGYLGALIAGGKSVRFGAPKARTEMAGLPMIAWGIRALGDAERIVVVGGDPALAAELGVDHLEDAEAGRGPLAGLVAALEAANEEGHVGVFALACDLPLVTSAIVRRIVQAGDGESVVAACGSEGPEPLCAFYPASCLVPAQERSRRGIHSLKGLLDALSVRLVAAEELGCSPSEDPFLNVNTPEDALAAEAVLAARAGTGASAG